MRFLFILLAFFAPLYIVFADVTFARNLSLGSNGDDVRALQILLNKDSRTAIAQSGPGSPGNETGFFGSLTLQAVITFQNLHAADILTPADLSSGSGFVGILTRNVLNSLETISTSTSPSVSALVPVSNSNTASTSIDYSPFLANDVSQQVVDTYFSGLEKLKNEVVTRKSSISLISASPTPLIFNAGGQVILSGSGFSSIGNTVSTDVMGSVENISSSDGRTIIFNMKDLEGALPVIQNEKSYTGLEVTINIWVSNSSGVSNVLSVPLEFGVQ